MDWLTKAQKKYVLKFRAITDQMLNDICAACARVGNELPNRREARDIFLCKTIRATGSTACVAVTMGAVTMGSYAHACTYVQTHVQQTLHTHMHIHICEYLYTYQVRCFNGVLSIVYA